MTQAIRAVVGEAMYRLSASAARLPSARASGVSSMAGADTASVGVSATGSSGTDRPLCGARERATTSVDPNRVRSGRPGGRREGAEPRALRAGYLEQLSEFTEQMKKMCRSMHIDFTRMNTGDALDVTLSGFLATRAATIK